MKTITVMTGGRNIKITFDVGNVSLDADNKVICISYKRNPLDNVDSNYKLDFVGHPTSYMHRVFKGVEDFMADSRETFSFRL